MAKRKKKKIDKIKISACYMVKNAAKDLRLSLDSVKDFVDEIIVVDTGSTDSTVEVAEEFGAKIFHEAWQDDFSAPRNVALREASGDWIVFLDADEYFINDTAKNLRAVIKLAQKANVQGLLINWVNVDKDAGNKIINSGYVLRMFENAPQIHYVGKIYEDVFSGEEPLKRTQAPANLLTLYHTGCSTSINLAEAERNLKLLLEELETSDKPERIYAYLADAYYALKDWANVEKFARLDLSTRKNPSSHPIKLLIECLEKDSSRFEECFEIYKLAVERYPKVPEFSAKLADCFAQKKIYREAVKEMQAAIDKAKNYGEQFESSNFDAEKINFARSLIDDWKKKISLTPEEKRREVSRLTDEMIKAVEVTHDMDKAVQAADKIFELKPDAAEVVEKVASLYIDCKLIEKAEAVIDYLEKNFPPTAYRVMLHARIYYLKKNFLDVIKFCEQALNFDGDFLTVMFIHNTLGKVYRDIGDAKNFLKHYGRNAKLDLSALKNSPQFAQAEKIHIEEYSNYLFNMHNLNFSREKIFEETLGFNKLLAHLPRYKHTRKTHARHKKIRVGYISPDIRYHVVTFFSYHLFMSYDKTRFEVFIYANNEEDHVTRQLKERVDGFRKILHLPYKEVAAQIVKDEIDILVDLAGHTANNLLPVMAYKPAPIQISGIGYFDSTGLDTIDYFLADKYTDPEGLNEKFFTEKILRLQHSHFCYEWHDFPYPVAPAPCTKNGYVTFVSFNNFTKVTDEMLKLWKKILDAVANSRLCLKSNVFQKDGGLEFCKQRLQAAGIDLNRVDLEGFETDYTRKYERADIALDTFPYPGGGTTCDALYMGVPVITLVGERHNSRFGYSLLMNIGLEELCAFSEEEYFQKAVELANDWERIREYHLTIRRKFEESPVMNDAIYMGELEAAYEKIFNAWLENKSLPDFPQEPEPVTEELAEKYFKRAVDYVTLENKIGESDFESRFDFKRTLYYAELAAQCESKRNAKLLLTIADRRHLLEDNVGAYEMMRRTLEHIYSPEDAPEKLPDFFIAECHRKMAKYAHDNRQHVEAIENYQRAFELTEDEARRLEIFDGMLLGLHFLDFSGEEMAAFHFDYQKFFEDVKPFTTYHKPHKRIKVGYISGDFRHHALFTVAWGFISCHDKNKFEITCYSKNRSDDKHTELYRRNVEHFIDVKNLSDKELAKKIHDDEIDIAFDLAGHTGYNGLPALVYRPAPVQICGIGYMSTTGLKEIDYFLTDEILDPPGEHEAHFSEKFLYMPAQFCYARREDVPTPEVAPCIENGYVTFGTICRYSKMTDDMLAVWSEILNRVPDAKLLMRAQEFISNRVVDELYATMKSFGCDMDRVIFRPAMTDYFEAISKIDIMLDGYPYVGGATTLDALYMGVPVINLHGERHSTRFGKSILASVGLGELSVNSIEAYINTAVALAGDKETLDVLHKNLRTMFLNSAALDPMKYCRLLEKKFEELLSAARNSSK
ncbi:MAG: glycosyltransferase [Selenomonadaceae bacterium]|nr:glycosyltransferase [Selenomonadaceae bacterium]